MYNYYEGQTVWTKEIRLGKYVHTGGSVGIATDTIKDGFFCLLLAIESHWTRLLLLVFLLGLEEILWNSSFNLPFSDTFLWSICWQLKVNEERGFMLLTIFTFAYTVFGLSLMLIP